MPNLGIVVSEAHIVAGRYVLNQLLGRGGVGEVWRATQQPLGRVVALKLLREEYAGNPQIMRRFGREARAASGLAHPNIASVFDHGTDDLERLYIAMELIEGISLTEAIEKGLSVRNTLELADQLLAGLAHAHARGVIHRDLKPDNIVLAGAHLPESIGIPKLVDFGIATVAGLASEDADDEPTERRDTMRGEVIGTPRYMSPEQAMGERNLSPRSDLYNVGLILYETLTGYPPYGDERGLAVMSRHVHDAIPPILARPGLEPPDQMIDAIMRALAKNPLERWSSAAEMRKALRPILDEARENTELNITPEPLVKPAARSQILTPMDNPAKIRQSPYQLEDEDGEVEVIEIPNALGRTPFVGRISERNRMNDLVARVCDDGRGSIVLISGEAGVGKTRLSSWLKEVVEENGLMRSNVGTFTRGGSSSLRGVQDVMESMFRTRGLPRAQVVQRVEQRLKQWGHNSEEDAAAVIDFIRPTAHDDTRPSSVSTSALFATLTRIIEIGAIRKPRLIILDDIHWAGRELADFFDYLAVELRHRRIPVLVVATIRTEDLAERPELESKLSSLSRYLGETVEKIELERFSGHTGRMLVDALMPMEDELADVVLERSSGNPLHLSFLIRYLRDENLLENEGGRYFARDLEQVRGAVPPSLADLFRVRIEQAEAHYKVDGRLQRHLEFAAVIGLRFQYEVLRRMIELSGDQDLLRHCDHDLDRLVVEGFFTEIEGRGDDWYSFSHGLLRDHLLRGIGPLVSRGLHRQAAEAMTEVFGAGADTFAMEIARHWNAARDTPKALEWYRRAAETAQRSFVLAQAATAWEEALEIMDGKLGHDRSNQPESQDPLLTHLDREAFLKAGIKAEDYLHALWRLGDLLEGFGDFFKAEAAYRRVVRIVGKDSSKLRPEVLTPLGNSWLGLGHIAWQRGDFEAADWAFRKVAELLRSNPAEKKLEVAATLGIARVAWHRADYEVATKLANESLKIARENKNEEGQAEALWILGEVQRMLGSGEEARQQFVNSIDIYRTINSPLGIARNLLSLAQVARYSKDFDEARKLYSRALSHYERLGDRRGAGMCHNGLGDVERLERRFEEADRAYGRALEIYEGIGAEYDVAIVLANLGLNALELEDASAAQTYLEGALNIVSGGDYPYLLAGIEYNLAVARARQGDRSGWHERVMSLATSLPIADIDYARPLEELAGHHVAAGEREAAVELWSKSLEIYEELGLIEDAERVRNLIQD